jgi:hypothetical protein
MYRYLHVTVAYANAYAQPASLEPTIGQLAWDWIRYSTVNWVLWTDKPITTVSAAIQPLIGTADHLVVLALNPHELPAGVAPSWVWEWFNRYRDPASGYVHFSPSPPIPEKPMTGNLFGLGGLGPPAPPLPNALKKP